MEVTRGRRPRRPEPTIKQMLGLMEFLLTHDSVAFPADAGLFLEQLRVRTEGIQKLEEQVATATPRMSQFLFYTESCVVWGLIEELQNMWYKYHGADAVHVLDYIKRITCEISLVRINMIHPESSIGEKDCCVFDVDDTLFHNVAGYPALALGIIPEFVSWILELQAKGYSIILLTARTAPHPQLQQCVDRYGIVVHKHMCASLSAYLPNSSAKALFERGKIAKQRSRLQLKAEGYRIHLTVGNHVGDVEDIYNRYLLPVKYHHA